MKRAIAVILVFVVGSVAHAGATLADARRELQEGNYAEAREIYEDLAKNAKTRYAATLGLSKALESQGGYDKAQSVIELLLKEMPKNVELTARLAELHYLRGRLDDAEKFTKAALELSKESYLARWILGQCFRDRGDFKKADEEFLWFVRAGNTKVIDDPEHLRLVGLAGLERARYHHLTDQYSEIISNFFGDAEKKDKLYWQAAYEAGRVFMEKHNKPAAFRAFERALTINPRAPEVLVCKGQMAASHFEFKDAERYAEQALRANPNYVPALCLLADVHLFTGEFEPAIEAINTARKVNPRDEATLAREAACRFAQGKKDDFEALVTLAKKNNPACYTFYTDLGSLLDQRKLQNEAEKYYRLAIKIQPKFADAQVGLGMLYMRMAKEIEAEEVLQEAAKADPFNVRVDNSLKVLKHLFRYQTIKTEHFIIRYDEKNDEILANVMAVYLEDIYKELAKQFDYSPKGPFQIQIFNRHEMFSGRVVAVPDLHTIGACTGPLVAMVSPKDTSKVIAKPFNWNRVLRHEIVHVFNLEQTNSKVPHWLTEGLAVRYEGPNIPPSWHGLLADKVRTDDLLNLDNILLGFIRPRSPLQWQQAYLQSLMYVEYLTKTHGEKAVGKMLAAFADGLDTGPALEKAVGVTKEKFEKGYLDFLKDKVKDLPGGAARKELTLRQLRDAHEKNPDDLDIAAQLADKNYQIGKKRDAKELADKVLRKQPRHVEAVVVKAKLLMDEGSSDIAYQLLDSVNNDELKDTKPLALLAKIQVAGKKFTQAARTAERARKIDPHDPNWIKALAKIYVQTEQKEKLLEIFEEVARIDPDDFEARKLLAQHYGDKGNHAEAEKYARLALEVDVTDGAVQSVLLDALTAQNKNADAARWRKLLGR
ncbi:MAG: tetratricopeptide repeat protein [Gemmataceae bacterium]|nr:tetratricopeptide repeat protein [Gemmataceae bacterium]